MMKKIFFLSILFCSLGSQAVQEIRVGKIFLLGQTAGEPLFIERSEFNKTSDLDMTTSATITDADGKVVMRETSRIEAGIVVEQTMDQLQINESYELIRKEDKIFFKTYKIKDGERKLDEENSEKLPSHFVTGPGTGGFLKSKSEELLNGKTVKAQFGIFELGKTIGFSFRKLSEKEDPILKIKMKVSNFLVAILVDPIEMELNPYTFQIQKYRGRTPVRIKDDNGWKPLDAEIHYTWTTTEKK